MANVTEEDRERASDRATERQRESGEKKRLMSIGNELERNSLFALVPSAESVHERIITSVQRVTNHCSILNVTSND